MADLAQLTVWRDALLRARYAGIRIVESDGRRVEYRSDGELRQALADVERAIREAERRPPVTQIRFSSSKGL